METLKLQTNVPEVIALKFATGLECQSKFGGDQVMFTLTDDRKVFWPPYLAQKIAEAGIVAGELFEVCKRETIAGNRRSVDYQIRTDLALRAPAVPTSAPSPVSTPNQVKHNAARVAPAGAAVLPSPAPAIEDAFTAAGKAAIDAVLIVEEYARSRGMVDFSFNGEAIEKIWMSLFIDSRKGGR